MAELCGDVFILCAADNLEN